MQFGGSKGSLNSDRDHDRSHSHPGVWPTRRDSDGETSSAHSSDAANALPARRTASGPAASTSSRGRTTHGHGHHHGRTLSTYSSVDSLLRRTMRTNMQGIGNTSRQASIHALFPSASASEVNLASSPSPSTSSPGGAAARSSPSPPPHLSRPSIGSMRSAGSAGARARPLSPLSTQLRDARAEDYGYGGGDDDEYDNGGVEDDADVDVDDVEEDDGEGGAGYTESELGHGLALGGAHPIPLPGMSMVPAGYTTFQHSALYGGGPGSGGPGKRGSIVGGTGKTRKSEEMHAGVAHGQSMQRLPMGMSGMMSTVSSTVSVGTNTSGSRRGGTR